MTQKSLLLLLLMAAPVLAQNTKPKAPPSETVSKGDAPSVQAEIPRRTLEFKVHPSPHAIALSPVTSVPQCDAEGALFLDMLDPKDFSKHSLISVKGETSAAYPLSAITDLHDVFVFSFFPTDSVVAFLVRATKETPGQKGAGKSPFGVAWRDYHNYLAEFNRDGTYKASIELPMDYTLSSFAMLSNGEILTAGYDRVNSAARLMSLDASGKVIHALDLPAARRDVSGNLKYGSIEEAKTSRTLIGAVAFTPYKQDILVWSRGSNDPILDVGPGGRTREVPLESPPGYVFVDMVPANDRWLAHFRSATAPENSAFTQATYSYYQLRPEDASLASRLEITGDAPQSIACESDGTFISYKMDKDSKFALLTAE